MEASATLDGLVQSLVHGIDTPAQHLSVAQTLESFNFPVLGDIKFWREDLLSYQSQITWSLLVAFTTLCGFVLFGGTPILLLVTLVALQYVVSEVPKFINKSIVWFWNYLFRLLGMMFIVTAWTLIKTQPSDWSTIFQMPFTLPF